MIERHVHAEPARYGHRIDQPGKHRPAGIAEIAPLAEEQPRHPLGRIALGRTAELLGAEPGGVDDGIDGDRCRIGAAEMRLPSAGRPHEALDRRVERDHAAAILEVALEREHVAMAVDDAGFRRIHRESAGERGLEPPRRGALDHLDPFDAVDRGLLDDRFEPNGFGIVGGHDELAALAVRHAMRGAEVVEHPPPAGTMIRPLGAGRVIEAGVDDLAVAGGHAGADAGGGLRDDHLVSGKRGRAPNRKPDHARSDHQNLHRFPARQCVLFFRRKRVAPKG